MSRPNILYLHVHDCGRYVQPYGYPVPTPAIQKLAEGGVVFRQAFCAGPTCSPSRAALLTGQSPHSCGMTGLAHLGFSISDYRHHLVHTLRSAGYASTLVGTQHVARDPGVIGYDQVVPLESWDKKAVGVAPPAVEFLKGKPKQPFFLSVGFSDTHRNFAEPGPENDPRWCRPPAVIPDTPETRRDFAAYRTDARQWDWGVGQVLGALEESGLAGNTLVICTTDHGIAFPGMKCRLTDSGTGVMLILRGPGGFTGGRNLDALVSHIDIFPTLCDLLEIDPPERLEGRSLMPLVRGGAEEINEEIFSEVSYHAAYEPMRSVRTRRHKYIRRFDGRTRPVLTNCDDGPSKDLWVQGGWRDRPVAEEQLYDLVFDPQEGRNLAGESAWSAVLEEMRGRLKRWMEETRDPLLSGPVPAPPGARGHDPDGLSPREELKPLA